MRTIGIRELKAQLSRALRDVQLGHTYLITDRGRVVAELRLPGGTAPLTRSPEENATLLAAVRGELRVAEGPPPTEVQRRSNIKMPAGTAIEWLDWTREG